MTRKQLDSKFKSLALRQILDTPDLPHRLIVYFAAQCAKDAMSKIKNPDPRSLAAIDVAERFGNGEAFEQSFLTKTWNDADAVAHAADAASAASAAANAAADAAHAAAYAAYAAAYAAYAAYSADAKGKEHYKPLLLDLINKRLTKVEILLIFGLWSK